MGNSQGRYIPESVDSYLTSNHHGGERERGGEVQTAMKGSDSLVFSSLTHHKGLSNPLGENHCFLNSTIQILWHTGAFRSQLTHLIAKQKVNQTSKEALEEAAEEIECSTFDSVLVSSDSMSGDANGGNHHMMISVEGKAEEVAVSNMTAATAVGMEEKDDGFVFIKTVRAQTAAGSGGGGPGIIDALCNLFTQYELSDKTVLPPDELRLALSEINTQFGLGNIADANEALLEILGRIHDESSSACPHQQRCLSHFILGGAVMEQAFCPLCHATSEPTVWESFVHNFSAQDLVNCAVDRGKRQNKVSFGRLLRDAMGVR
jgi:hypothetical protein